MVLKNTMGAGAHTYIQAWWQRWALAAGGGGIWQREAAWRWQREAVAASSKAVAARRWQRDAGCSEAVAARGGGCDTVAASGNGAVAVRRRLARRWLATDGDRIAILNKGKIVALDSTKNLLDRIQTKKVTFKTDKIINIKDEDIDSLKVISKFGTEICVSYEKSKIDIEELINLIKKDDVKIIDISTDDGDLEDVFLRLIKN